MVDLETFGEFDDDSLNDCWIYINGGTGVGQERQITDFVKSSGQISVPLNHVWDTNPDATSTYEITRKWKPSQYDRAIDMAIRRSKWAHAMNIRERYHLTGTDLPNPLFTDWNSAVDEPDGWSNDTTHLACDAIPAKSAYNGNTVTVKAMVWANFATATVRALDAGGSQDWTHPGDGTWRELGGEYTVGGANFCVRLLDTAANITAVSRHASQHNVGPHSVQLSTTSGSMIIDWIYVERPWRKLDYYLQADDADGSDRRTDFMSVHDVKLSYGLPSETSPLAQPMLYSLDQHDWDILPDREGDALMFKSEPPKMKLLEIHGLGTEITGGDDDDILRIDQEVVEMYATYRLMMMEGNVQQAASYREEWERLKAETRVFYPAYSKLLGA